ncbi:hypothetical protein EJ06DRAFT_480986 [Trichodelitschia bisporula]|uniref:Nuclear distribution protein RO10 n=1 Tax=Trichodelitschia bisporula TaxID=703511 RepID=A0A6G1HQ14_9PEZI|nr:hypothetical protein EJ06DRAFT_480986 [Trichodelitschia bisporula]
MDDAALEDVLLQTLDLLAWRLRRLEFVLDGRVIEVEGTEDRKTPSVPVVPRLQRLESTLQQLASRSEVVSDLLKLQSQHPNIFTEDEPKDASSEPDTTQQLAMVLTDAPRFSTITSQLRSLSDFSVPPTSAFASVIALQPRLAQLEEQQYRQAMEISELRKRTGALVLQWHELFILGQGQCWAEWDTRLRNAERSVRREEVRRMEDGV